MQHLQSIAFADQIVKWLQVVFAGLLTDLFFTRVRNDGLSFLLPYSC